MVISYFYLPIIEEPCSANDSRLFYHGSALTTNLQHHLSLILLFSGMVLDYCNSIALLAGNVFNALLITNSFSFPNDFILQRRVPRERAKCFGNYTNDYIFSPLSDADTFSAGFECHLTVTKSTLNCYRWVHICSLRCYPAIQLAFLGNPHHF